MENQLKKSLSCVTPGAMVICDRLKSENFLCYVVGGAVRDALLDESSKEVDLATDATPEVIQNLFSETWKIGEQFGIIAVREKGEWIEVATFRKDGKYEDHRHPDQVRFSDPETDAKRRDFTINGLFYDPSKELVIDYVGGLEDLSERKLRTIGDPEQRFKEDPLRILRAIRFAHRFLFEMDSKTREALSSFRTWIHKISAERIREELFKLFTQPRPEKAFQELVDSRLWDELFLPLTQDERELVNERLIKSDQLAREEQASPSTLLLLRFSCLLSCSDHYKLDDFFKRIRFSKKMSSSLQTIRVLAHKPKSKSPPDLVTLYELSQEKFGEALYLFWKTLYGDLESVLKLRAFLKKGPIERMVDGQDLIDHSFKPGPHFHRILRSALAKQLEGAFQSKEEAIEWTLQTFAKFRIQ